MIRRVPFVVCVFFSFSYAPTPKDAKFLQARMKPMMTLGAAKTKEAVP